jgi:FkbM family methyltransferase
MPPVEPVSRVSSTRSALTTAKTATYEAVDVLTRRRGIARKFNGHTVRFPPRWARYYPGEYEPAKQSFLEERCSEGGTVIDGGAHIGLFTVIMARSVGPAGRVLAFEPTPDTRAVLTRTLKLNEVDNVTVWPSALSSTSGTALFHATSDPGSNANSLGRGSRSAVEYSVNTCSLDDLALDRVSCIKLDIEGGELDALLGAGDLLRRDRPAIAMEVHPEQLLLFGQSSKQLWEVLAEHGAVVRRNGRLLDEAQFTRESEPFEVQITLDERP